MRTRSPGWALGMDAVIPQKRPEKRHATPPGAAINNLIFGTWTDRSSGTHWRGIHNSNYSRSTCCHHRDRCNRVSRRSTSSYTKCHTDASQTWGFADNLNFTVSMCLLKGEKHCMHAYIYIYTVRPFQSHLRLKTTTCDYEKIFRSTSATDPISIFVLVLREL